MATLIRVYVKMLYHNYNKPEKIISTNKALDLSHNSHGTSMASKPLGLNNDCNHIGNICDYIVFSSI